MHQLSKPTEAGIFQKWRKTALKPVEKELFTKLNNLLQQVGLLEEQVKEQKIWATETQNSLYNDRLYLDKAWEKIQWLRDKFSVMGDRVTDQAELTKDIVAEMLETTKGVHEKAKADCYAQTSLGDVKRADEKFDSISFRGGSKEKSVVELSTTVGVAKKADEQTRTVAARAHTGSEDCRSTVKALSEKAYRKDDEREKGKGKEV